MSTIAFCVADQLDWSRPIIRVLTGIVAVAVAGVIVVGGIFVPGDLPHIDTPETLPGPNSVITPTVSRSTITLGDAPPAYIVRW